MTMAIKDSVRNGGAQTPCQSRQPNRMLTVKRLEALTGLRPNELLFDLNRMIVVGLLCVIERKYIAWVVVRTEGF